MLSLTLLQLRPAMPVTYAGPYTQLQASWVRPPTFRFWLLSGLVWLGATPFHAWLYERILRRETGNGTGSTCHKFRRLPFVPEGFISTSFLVTSVHSPCVVEFALNCVHGPSLTGRSITQTNACIQYIVSGKTGSFFASARPLNPGRAPGARARVRSPAA